MRAILIDGPQDLETVEVPDESYYEIYTADPTSVGILRTYDPESDSFTTSYVRKCVYKLIGKNSHILLYVFVGTS